jgi:hypothetical protein
LPRVSRLLQRRRIGFKPNCAFKKTPKAGFIIFLLFSYFQPVASFPKSVPSLEITKAIKEQGMENFLLENNLLYCRHTKYKNLIQLSVGPYSDLNKLVVQQSNGLILDESKVPFFSLLICKMRSILWLVCPVVLCGITMTTKKLIGIR